MALMNRLIERLGAPFARSSAGASGGPAAPRLSLRFDGLIDRLLDSRAARLLNLPGAREGGAPDPAKILFPAQNPRADEDSDRRGSLADNLKSSARDIQRRQGELSARARALAIAVEQRIDGEATLIAQALRILIAMVWVVAAFALAWSRLSGDASWIAYFGPIAAGDVMALARAFAIIAAAGLGVAFLRAFVVFALGKGNNNVLRARASELGEEAAMFALEFDAELDRRRRDMDGRQQNPADAVQDLSRAHLTALEAAVFFRGIQFLTDSDREEAALKFRGFLKGHANRVPASIAAPVFGLGFFLGAIYTASLYPTPPAIILDLKLPPIADYPWAIYLILGGAIIYAVSGLVVEAFRPLFTAGAAVQARDEALDAVRSGFIAKNAPLIEAVIQRIVDALDVYRARVAGARPRASDSPPSASEETPSWRRKPEAPRFVETSFQATPKAWLADPPTLSSPMRKKNFLTSETGPKRSLFGFKKSPDA